MIRHSDFVPIAAVQSEEFLHTRKLPFMVACCEPRRDIRHRGSPASRFRVEQSLAAVARGIAGRPIHQLGSTNHPAGMLRSAGDTTKLEERHIRVGHA